MKNNTIPSETCILFAKASDADRVMIPEKRKEDAGYDLYACFENNYIRIPAHDTVLIPTGIASALPESYYFQIEEKSSTASKFKIKKSAGIIDSGYRGEWMVACYNTNDEDMYIVKKDHEKDLLDAADVLGIKIHTYPYEKSIAQAILHHVIDVDTKEISYDELYEIKSERMAGGFGSTGK